jgi:signal peptidase I
MRDDCRQSLVLEVLREHGEIRISALGLSMLPTLWPGDVLTIRAVTVDQCEPGDIILCEWQGRLVIHRVMRREFRAGKSCLITRGDAISHEDSAVCARQVLGRVAAVERQGQTFAVPRLSGLARTIGLLLSSSARVRSLALRMRGRGQASNQLNTAQSTPGSM